MTQVAILSRGEDLSPLAPALARIAPHLDVRIAGTAGGVDIAGADVAICWNPPPGVLHTLPRLRLVHAAAAGVDNILADPHYPAHIPLCRIVDADQARGMSEFATWSVLYFHRHFDQVLHNQRDRRWVLPPQAHASSCTIGVMGLGAMGLRVARDLAHMDFRVRGWSRNPRNEPNIESFVGDAALPVFLANLDILICVLPLTARTQGIIDASLLRQLRRGAKLIHIGRGTQVVVADLIAALENGTLGGAIVDVFDTEPLPADHVLWQTPNLVVTPHMASSSSIDIVADQIAGNIERLERGEPLHNQVDPREGF